MDLSACECIEYVGDMPTCSVHVDQASGKLLCCGVSAFNALFHHAATCENKPRLGD